MKKLATLIALCLAFCAVCTLAACQKDPTPSAAPSVSVSVDPLPLGEVLSVTETQIVISVNEVSSSTTLITVMEDLKERGAFTYEIANGMILSINGKAPVGNEFWGLYTSDTELSNTAWGTATYEGKTYGSAMFGAEDLPVIENGIYIWQISTF